jgi:hypothetical protein
MQLFADSKSLDEVEDDLRDTVGQLLTPLTYRKNFRPDQPFGIDNGCFATFHKDKYFRLLERELPNAKYCKFVAIPDVVGSARRTLELFEHYRHHELICRFKKALVIQNGQENLPIQWDLIDAVFIGGDDRFKMSNEAKHVIQCAQRLGKWVHIGRTNDEKMWQHFEEMGCDSFDGTGVSQFSWQRFKIAMHRDHPKLDFALAN